MLSYRHAFHAGNHADVLKHFVLMQVLAYATQKIAPFWYIDTHAGAGKYALDKSYALQNAEFTEGISRLWQDPQLPPALQPYLDLVKKLNPDGQLRHYPGSPACALEVLRNNDKLRLFELHPNDFKQLKLTVRDAGLLAMGRKVMIESRDGFAGIKALLPPPSRRAVVLIDPPYEDKHDYQRVIEALKDSLQRFATGTYMIWYPLLQRSEPNIMLDKLKKMSIRNWLDITLQVHKPALGGFGMHGSGLFIVNPPWTLAQTLSETMPYLVKTLGQDDEAKFVLENRDPAAAVRTH